MSTIKMIFLKQGGIGLLIENENLDTYNNLYKQAMQLYKMAHGPIEVFKGVKKTVTFEKLTRKFTDQEKALPIIGIIFIKEDNTALFLTGEGFRQYQENFFLGKRMLKTKFEVKGKHVKVTLT